MSGGKSDIPKNCRNVAVGAAMQASRILMEYYGKTMRVDAKEKNDFVTEADRRSEEAVLQHIRRSFPDHEILAEETGSHSRSDRFRWIVDPLDGTTNFIHGVPMFCVSIALEIEGELSVAVVYDPVHKELFAAEKGKGAFLNDRRIRVSTTGDHPRCLLATGFPFRNLTFVDDYLNVFRWFMARTAGIRRAGSAALDLCYLACGRFDGFWELNLNPWDIAAGALLIHEAGGRITTPTGGDDVLLRGNIVGSNGLIHAWMLDGIRETLGDRVHEL